MAKWVHPTARHDYSDGFDDHVRRDSVNPGVDYRTWRLPAYDTHKVPFWATADGVITVVSPSSGRGDIGYVQYTDIYGYVHQDLHVSRIDVVVGQRVKQYQQLGLTGDTGAEDSPHLHHSFKLNGVNLDFELYVGPDEDEQPEEKEEDMAKQQFVVASTNGVDPWYVTDGIYKRKLGAGEADYLVQMNIAEYAKDAQGKEKKERVHIIGAELLGRLIDTDTVLSLLKR